ncbi:hypothetical protein HDV00_002021 [Rhizophlyctis rosea]|nr:hypothetical protein HDV00_002021 [Rhizophlyctis rosea]
MPFARKIDAAVDAVQKMVRALQRENVDRVCVGGFNNSYRMVQPFTATESHVHHSLNRMRNMPDGATRLYDSIMDMVNYMRTNGKRDRPWVLIVITDGHDNCSTRSAKSCGQEVLRMYNSEASNFVFVIGVGTDVKQDKMEQMADAGDFSFVPIASFDVLEELFMLLALRIEEQVSGAMISTGNTTWLALQQRRRLASRPMDYAFLLDISGSMSEPANAPRCFEGHILHKRHRNKYEWTCDVCGCEPGVPSEHHCSTCDFDTCSKHIDSTTGKIQTLSVCRSGHPLIYRYAPTTWICDECKQRFSAGPRLFCGKCKYEMCNPCLQKEMSGRILQAMLRAAV